MPEKSCSEKGRNQANTASYDNSLLVVGCPFLPLQDSYAPDFCLQPPKVFAYWESWPGPLIVLDEESTGCFHQEDVNSNAGQRRRECGGTAKGPGETGVWECTRWGTTGSTRRKRMGRTGSSWEKLAVTLHWEPVWCDRGCEKSMMREMNVRGNSETRPLHLKASSTTAISGREQEKVDSSPP